MNIIIEKAFEEFNEYGIKFTMDSLSKRLGISKRTLYESFKSKEEIVKEMITAFKTDIKSEQKMVLEDRSLSNVEKLRGILTIVPGYGQFLNSSKLNQLKKAFPDQYNRISAILNDDWEMTYDLMDKCITNKEIDYKDKLVFKEVYIATIEKIISDDFLINSNLTYKDALLKAVDILLYGFII